MNTSNVIDTAKSCDLIGFFPGLGSRASYKKIYNPLAENNLKYRDLYTRASNILSSKKIKFDFDISHQNIPREKMMKESYIGALFYLYNYILFEHFKERTEVKYPNLNFKAVTGESIGIINASVAAGSLNFESGLKIAHFLTPFILLASDKQDDVFSEFIYNYMPKEIRNKLLISEPYFVVAVKGDSIDLQKIKNAFNKEFLPCEVEVHKNYSKQQINVYVKTSIKSCFDLFMKNYPEVEVENLKEPTIFITHSKQLTVLRDGLALFIKEQNIIIEDPQIPIIANHKETVLETKENVYQAILAIVDEIMDSSATAEILNNMGADCIIEFGLGGKSIKLLRANYVRIPFFSFEGETGQADSILNILYLLHKIKFGGNSDILKGMFEWIDCLKTENTYNKYFIENIISSIDLRVVNDDKLQNSTPINVGDAIRYSSIFYNHLKENECVSLARVKRNFSGRDGDEPNTFYDLTITNIEGKIRHETTQNIFHSECTVFYMSDLDKMSNAEICIWINEIEQLPLADEIFFFTGHEYNLIGTWSDFLRISDENPSLAIQAMRRIILQVLCYHLLLKYKAAIFSPERVCVCGHGIIGWLAALICAGVSSLDSVMLFCRDYFSSFGRKISTFHAMHAFTKSLRQPKLTVLSQDGLSIQSIREFETQTFDIISKKNIDYSISINIDAHLLVVSLDSQLDSLSIDNFPFQNKKIRILSPGDLFNKNTNLEIYNQDLYYQMFLTTSYKLVNTYSRKRNLFPSIVNSYININEVATHFCHGGSESMTMFVRKDGLNNIFVRKILSEALTVAKWHEDGNGVMLPPFSKAAQQVEYLNALPIDLQEFFPKVYNVVRREIPNSIHKEEHLNKNYKELIYDMSFVPGIEVSQFIEKFKPATELVARIYSIIFVFIRDHIHTVNVSKVKQETLELSYFKKIESRLALCTETAPNCFNSDLLESNTLTINGHEYMNIRNILNVFRSHPEFCSMLEPKYHNLVMGDTNTENIKISNIEPLLEYQSLIDDEATKEELHSKLLSINANTIGLKFLDPRAIGFMTHGEKTIDDYMYDNKPWHNSIGHYDEIHNELFDLEYNRNSLGKISININYKNDSFYANSYNVLDCIENDINISDAISHNSIEGYFSEVMTNLYETAPSNSVYNQDPLWLIRFVFMMGTHFAAMPPFHFVAEFDGTIKDLPQVQKRPIAIYCQGIKWLNWSIELLTGQRTQFLGVTVPQSLFIESKAI